MTAPSRHAAPDGGSQRRIRVLHFVTGGFSGGATQVAVQLVRAARDSDAIEPLLVLRRKRQTPAARLEELQRDGVPMAVVPGWSHAATILALVRLCRQFRPDVLVAHGFSEHLWGRYAGLLAKVPHLVHVEHNTRERYTRWRLLQSRWLARRTDRIVGCSEGVREALLALGMPSERTMASPNGIQLASFADADAHPFEQRTPGIVMVARFSKQKDHATLLRAVALLAARGLHVPVQLLTLSFWMTALTTAVITPLNPAPFSICPATLATPPALSAAIWSASQGMPLIESTTMRLSAS